MGIRVTEAERSGATTLVVEPIAPDDLSSTLIH